MTKDMFDGFGHEKHKDEVIERWGEDAWQRSDSWWISKSPEQQQEWQQVLNALNADWQKAAADGAEPGSDRAQELAARHVDWLRDLPQQMTPDDFLGYVKGLGEMYVNDPRFAANYGGEQGATLVRDALNIYVDKHL